MLYDTYGFPLEITQEVAAERGIRVDLAAFEEAMQAQRAQSQAAAVAVDVTADSLLARVADAVGETAFLGYDQLTAQARVVALLVDGKPASSALPGQAVELVLDSSPFYAESGGQVGDRGTLHSEDGATSVRVTDVQKAGGGRLFLHRGEVFGTGVLEVEAVVSSSVDPAFRRRVRLTSASRIRAPDASSAAYVGALQPHSHAPAAGCSQVGAGHRRLSGGLTCRLWPPSLRLQQRCCAQRRAAGPRGGPDQRLDWGQRGGAVLQHGTQRRARLRRHRHVRREIRGRGARGGRAGRIHGALRWNARQEHRRNWRLQGAP